MKFKKAIDVKSIAQQIGAKLVGNGKLQVGGMNEIHKVVEGDLTFVDVQKYYSKSLGSAASVIIIDQEVECPEGKTLLVHPEPFNAYNSLAKYYKPFKSLDEKQEDSARIHETSIIEPNVIIGENVVIGENCYIQANAYIGNDTVIGDRVIIQAGAILGTDAFYYHHKDGEFTNGILQIGQAMTQYLYFVLDLGLKNKRLRRLAFYSVPNTW